MIRPLTWFVWALMAAATGLSWGSASLAGADNAYLIQRLSVAEADAATTHEQAAKLQSERGRLQRELICMRDVQACDHLMGDW